MSPSRRSWLAALLLWGLSCAGAQAASDPIAFTFAPVYLNPEDIRQVEIGQLRFLAGFELTTDDHRFGGLSSLLIEPDGTHFLGITDTARWLTGRVLHDRDGRLSGIADGRYGSLHNLDGSDLAPDGPHALRDSEAVTKTADGDFLVSFERRHRIWRYAGGGAGIDGTPAPYPAPAGLARAPSNGGLEAMTMLPDGRLLLVTEDLRDDRGDLVGWLTGPKGTREIRYAATGIFQPTELASLPNGDVLVLERRFTVIGGAGGRIARIPAAQLAGGDRLESEELAVLQPPMTVDNYEAMTVAPAPGGGWFIYVASDDNFSGLQRTLLLQFHWPGR